jgi:hypothetical protein
MCKASGSIMRHGSTSAAAAISSILGSKKPLRIKEGQHQLSHVLVVCIDLQAHGHSRMPAMGAKVVVI